MARLPRYFAKDIPQHVILRGNNRQAIYADGADYLCFKDYLLDAIERHGLAIHAYVLMTNHVHLLATPQTADSLPGALQSLGRRYVQYFNRRNQRTGTLWEGRYRATVVDADDYLYECMRYIELNPVRAGMVVHPSQYPWSSYRANAEGGEDPLVTPHSLYRRLGANAAERRHAYREIATEPLPDDKLAAVRNATHRGWALGDQRFLDRLARQTERRPGPLHRGRPHHPTADQTDTPSRDAARPRK